MKDIVKYTDVIRYGKNSTKDVLKVGDYISITEKLDGANASFRVDYDNPNGVSCYSRRKVLDDKNTLRGFYPWVLDNIVPIKNELDPDYIYYGEWLVPHKVTYKEDKYYQFYLFSILDTVTNRYVADPIVIDEACRLGLNTVDYFYLGFFHSYDHLKSYVGKSHFTATRDNGEGIVVKNASYRDNFNKQCFVKLVSDKFTEVQIQKRRKKSPIDEQTDLIIKSVLTAPRVEKIMYKLVDEGDLTKDEFELSNMAKLLKLLYPRVLEDMLKEESDVLGSIEANVLQKRVGKVLPTVVKQILKDFETNA